MELQQRYQRLSVKVQLLMIGLGKRCTKGMLYTKGHVSSILAVPLIPVADCPGRLVR